MKRGLVVFDLDGTLIDSSADLRSALNAALDRLHPGTPPLALETVRSMIGEGALRLVAKALRAAAATRAVEKLLPVFLDATASACSTRRASTRRAGDAGGARRPALAVLTNKPGDFSRTIVKASASARFFARVCGRRRRAREEARPRRAAAPARRDEGARPGRE